MATKDTPALPHGPTAQPETVTVPVSTLAALQARLDALEEAASQPRTLVLDAAWEAEKAALGRPANVRTQELADRTYGTTGQRFRVAMDSTTEDGKPGPSIGEHFPLEICAHSDLEAAGRYQKVMGILKSDYPIRAVPVAA